MHASHLPTLRRTVRSAGCRLQRSQTAHACAKLVRCSKSESQDGGEGTRLPSTDARSFSRRAALSLGSTTAALLGFPNAPAKAMPESLGSAWEMIGGGPPDLFYPDEFLGTWQVVSTLVAVDVPMGEEMLNDARAVQRAKATLNQALTYEQRFVLGSTGKVIADRPFNVDALTTATLGGRKLIESVDWDADNPNTMRIRIKDSPEIYSRVTKRFQDDHPETKKLETSEVVEQVFPDREGRAPKVKGSRCLTKYKWRTAEEAKGGPAIVATQVVSDFVTAFDGADRVFEAQGRPAVVYTYRMSFQKSSA